MHYLIALLMTIAALTPLSAHAARLYFDAPAEAGVGMAVPVTLLLDTEGADVNALEGAVLVSGGAIAGIRETGSVIPLWVERPDISGQASTFSGIIPGGFRGLVGPFWDGVRPGAIYTLLVEADRPGTVSLTLGPSARVFLNDGQGTEAPVTVSDVSIAIVEGAGAPADLPADTEPPEEFVPEIGRSDDVFGGARFVAFSAVDLMSGIGHYEVAEGKSPRSGDAAFVRAESPFRLADQTGRSYTFVKAVDRAGNERIAVVDPSTPMPWYASWWAVSLLALLALLGIGWIGYARYTARNSHGSR